MKATGIMNIAKSNTLELNVAAQPPFLIQQHKVFAANIFALKFDYFYFFVYLY